MLRPSQVDCSYTGTPDRFVAARGAHRGAGLRHLRAVAWEHEVAAWGKPLAYALVADTGYPNYANLLAIRPADRPRLDRCLRRLVPIIQQAQVEFMANPAPTVDLIVRAVARAARLHRTPARSPSYAVTTMRTEGIVDNGRDHTIGDFDNAPGRPADQRSTPIFTGQRKAIKAALTPSDVVTNDYLDPSIGLPATR